MGSLLEVNDIFKNIGSKQILKGLSFSLEPGVVLGIMGPNGNGKTTLLNVIQGFLKPTFGDVKIDGINVGAETKKIVSYLQDQTIFPKRMTIEDSIKFYRTFFEEFDNEKMNSFLEIMKLEKKAKIRNLSKGMMEKLCLSLVLSRKVKLYLLDEPISGVDPVAREKILDAIIDNINEDCSMIITTHYVGELERVFDKVLFIGDGKVVEQGDAEELRTKYGKSIDGIYRHIFAE